VLNVTDAKRQVIVTLKKNIKNAVVGKPVRRGIPMASLFMVLIVLTLFAISLLNFVFGTSAGTEWLRIAWTWR
jgi:hypothetical protein